MYFGKDMREGQRYYRNAYFGPVPAVTRRRVTTTSESAVAAASVAAAPASPERRASKRLASTRPTSWSFPDVGEMAQDDDDDVPEENRDIVCVTCARTDGSMLVCDSRLCRNGVHPSCVVPPFVDDVPAHQFHCDHCLENFVCAVCNEKSSNNKDWISCDVCGVEAHVVCFGEQRFEDITSAFACAKCRCLICSDVVSTRESAFVCAGCDKLFHAECDPEWSPEANLCSDCVFEDNVGNMGGGGDAGDTGGDVDDVGDLSGGEDVGGMDIDPHHHALDDLDRPPARLPAFVAATRALQALAVNRSASLNFWAIQQYVRGLSITPGALQDLMGAVEQLENLDLDTEQVQLLRRSLPPGNIARFLKTLCPLTIKNVILKHTVGSLEFNASTAFREPAELFAQLLGSKANYQAGPRYSAPLFSPCGAVVGNRFAEWEAKLDAQFPNDKAEGIERCFYLWLSDGTFSSYSSMHPVFLTLANMSYDAVVNNAASAVLEFAFLPTLQSLTCRNARTGTAVAISEVRDKANEALVELKLQCVQRIFQVLADTDVLRFTLFDKEHAYRLVPYAFVCDLEEQRLLFNLAHSQFWSCGVCYNLHRGFDYTSLEGLNVDLNRRTHKADQELRLHVSETYDEPKRLLYLLGIKEDDKARSVFIRRNGRPVLAVVDDPVDLVSLDTLHVLHGALNHVYYMLSTYVCSKQWAMFCAELGDKSFSVARTISFVRFEDYIRDWYYVVMALLLDPEPLRSNVNLVDATALRELGVELLFLSFVCKDDAPGNHLAELEESCARAWKCYQLVFATVKEAKEDKSVRRGSPSEGTLKIHLLMHHLPAMVRQYGCLKQQSTLLLESTHKTTKRDVSIGGLHIDHRPAALLRKNFVRALLADVGLVHVACTPSTVPRPRDQYTVRAMNGKKYTVLGVARAAFRNLSARVQGLAEPAWLEIEETLPALELGDEPVFGTTLSCSVVDANRSGATIKSKIDFRVPFTSSERALTGRLMALSYKPGNADACEAQRVAEAKRCRSECCIAHNGGAQLFPTLARARASAVGIPLVFVGQFALVLELKSAVDDVDWPWQRVIPRFSTDYDVAFVHLSFVRDQHILVFRDGFLYQCLAGSRAFGHLS